MIYYISLLGCNQSESEASCSHNQSKWSCSVKCIIRGMPADAIVNGTVAGTVPADAVSVADASAGAADAMVVSSTVRVGAGS